MTIEDVVSVRVRARVWMVEAAVNTVATSAKAAPIAPAAAVAECARSSCGTSITMTPANPIKTADQRKMRTRSLRKIAAKATVMRGARYEIAVASTTGRRASAEKLQ